MQSKETEVYQAIAGYFPCDRRRIKFISCLMVSLLKLTHCSLSRWSRGVSSPTQLASRYKRLQRLVGCFRFSGRLYARLVWSLYGQGPQVVLTLDRTEYQQRGVWVQVLMLGIAYQGMSIPLLWHTSNRHGNASRQARQALMRALRAWLPAPAQQRRFLTADREFIGPELRQAGVEPVIRVRKNALVSHRGRQVRVHTFFETKQLRILRTPRTLYKSRLYLAGAKLDSGDYLILMSQTYLPQMARIYAQRWQIETLFGAFKSRGFHLEQCRVNHHRRIHTLLFVLAMTLIWAIRVGQWLVGQGRKIPLKKLKTGPRPVLSGFRHGLDYLQDVALNQTTFHHLTRLLSCT